MDVQGDLFGVNIREMPNFIWSYSRREVLEHCPRKYYYHYYGSSSRTAKIDQNKEDLKFLKKLSNRHMRIGSIFHLIVSTYFKKLIEGETWELQRLLRWAQSIYQKEYEFSKNFNSSSNLTDDYQNPILLLELYYKEVNAEELYKESAKRLLEAIKSFFSGSLFTYLQSVRFSPYFEIEKPVSPKICNFSTRGRIDIIHRNDNNYEIHDWKIGESNNPEDSLQLLYYALWAIDEFHCKPEDINVHKISLLTRNVSNFNVSSKSLQRTKVRIMQDVEKMKSLDKYGNNGIEEAFTPCRKPKICALCQYKEVCLKDG